MRPIPDDNATFPAEAPLDVWLRVTVGVQKVDFQTLLGDFTLSIPALRRNIVLVGGMASMIGGAIWIALFLLLQLDSSLDLLISRAANIGEVNLLLYIRFYFPDEKVLVIPLLSFLLGSLGLYARLPKAPSLLGKFGISMVVLGLGLAILGVATDADYTRWFRDDPLDGTMFLIEVCCPWQSSLWTWFTSGQPGYFVMSIGLVFFGASVIRARVLPVRAMVMLIVGVWLMEFVPYLVPSFLSAIFQIEYFYSQEWLEQYGILTASALLFGASWVWLGKALWSEKSAPSIQTESTTS